MQTGVRHGPRAQAEQFGAAIEGAMAQRGGPPDGLMVHLTRPQGDGFILTNVWRSEAEMRPFYDEVVLPALAEAGLEPEESSVSPAGAFARP